jgi:hypothetical protein
MPQKNNPFEQFQSLERQAVYFQRQAELTQEILAKQPDLGYVTAFIQAGDIVNSEKVDTVFQAGEIPFETACRLIGSYARFDWVVKQLDAGKVTPEQVYPMLPELWSGSDPDDTNPRYLKLWWNTYGANLWATITDKKELPRRQTLTVYRGQDRTAESIGIAWSLDYFTASKFARGAWARQRDRDGVVLVGTVRRSDIIAYIVGRGEEELIIDPKYVNLKDRRSL